MKIFKELNEIAFSNISLNQFYGIELDDFAHEVAILSLWLAEHQMNQIFFEEFGRKKTALPLTSAGNIVHGNACRLDWEVVCPKSDDDEIYIMGNPPFLGSRNQNDEQKIDMACSFKGIKDYKKLDYISCWFYLGSNYIKNSNSKYAFVTTNSITQGEQVPLIWPIIFNKNQEIDFAHQSFKWTNNAKDNAVVAVVIIGVRNVNNSIKTLYSQNLSQEVKNISPYLTNSSNIFVQPRNTSLSKFPIMITGSAPCDDGNLILEEKTKENLVSKNPSTEMLFKKYVGAQELISKTYRYCLYVNNSMLNEANKHQEIVERFEKVRRFRLKSKKSGTKIKSDTPHLFDEDRYQKSDFILVPKVGSERREYLPLGFYDDSFLPSNTTKVIYDASTWLFGILSSKLHIVWVKAVAGRLKTDMQYSNTLCYNTFPFPSINENQKNDLEKHVYKVLEERENHSEKTLAQLYDPEKMPNGLREAHHQLDLAVERCYRSKPFESDEERLEYLFKLYEQMIAEEKSRGTLFGVETKPKRKKK
jgi:hypothetical protein